VIRQITVIVLLFFAVTSLQAGVAIQKSTPGNSVPYFAHYIKSHATSKTLSLIPEFRKLDLYGSPIRNDIPGFGEEACTLSQLLPFSQYYVYNLPEFEMLIDKIMSTLSFNNASCLDVYEELPLDSIDLFISNYALTECDRETQLDHFKRVVVKAQFGYILYNNTNLFEHLTLTDFVELFQAHGIRPIIHPEPAFSYAGNILIT